MNESHLVKGTKVRFSILIRLRSLLLLLYSPLIASGLGLHADLKDVYFGASVFIAKPICDFNSAASDQMRFSPGVGLKVFAIAPMVDFAQLRSGLSFSIYTAYNEALRETRSTLRSENSSIESDILLMLSGTHARNSIYLIVGGSVDHIHYIGFSRGDDSRITDNGLNVGIGRNYQSDGRRFIVELVYHKTVVHDAEILRRLPHMDRVQFNCGAIF